IGAWTLGTETGFTFEKIWGAPRLALKADAISGHQGGDVLGTFNPLFPRGNYFGEISLIGPANLIDLHPVIEWHPHSRVTWSTDCDFFWRETLNDGLDNSGLALLVPSGKSKERYVGGQLSTQVEWRLHRRLSLTFSYSHFFAGPFLKGSSPGKDVDFFA